MNEIINIFENSMSLTVTTVIAAIGVGLNVWFKKKATGDPKREELIKSKFEIYKDMYLQIVLIKRSHCLNKSASEIDEIIKNYYKNLIENERDKLVLLDGRTINLFEDIFNEKHMFSSYFIFLILALLFILSNSETTSFISVLFNLSFRISRFITNLRSSSS